MDDKGLGLFLDKPQHFGFQDLHDFILREIPGSHNNLPTVYLTAFSLFSLPIHALVCMSICLSISLLVCLSVCLFEFWCLMFICH